MNKHDIELLHIKEITSILNLDEKIDEDAKNRLKIAFLFVLQYQKGNEASALHSVVRFILDDKTLLEGGASLIFKSKTWDDMNHDEDTVKASDFATQLIGYALPFISGMQFVKTKDTVLNGIFLPMINPAELRDFIRVEEVKSQSQEKGA